VKRSNSYVIWGLLLVAAGILFLLQNFGLVHSAWNVLFAALFAIGGIVFVTVFANNSQTNWWAVIPGFTLLGLAGLIGLGSILPESATGSWLAGLFLGAIGLSFWVIYYVKREFWWAVIPGGVLVALALGVSLADLSDGMAMPAIFFLGMAATFAVVYFLPTPQGRMRWAAIPALVLGIMGLAFAASMGEMMGLLWPAVLIIAGVVLIGRTFLSRQMR
jgi:hypothetical protein